MTNASSQSLPGDGVTDVTAKLQAAIDAGAGGIVFIPPGVHMVNASIGLLPHSDTSIVLAPGAVLKVIPNNYTSYRIFKLQNVSNVHIEGGELRGDRDDHIGTEGEWGHGIEIYGSSDISICGMRISKMWGDGVFVYDYEDTPSSQIAIDRSLIAQCRRNGVAVGSALGVIISRTRFEDISGTAPGAAVDIEPDHAPQRVRDAKITQCHFLRCVKGVNMPCDHEWSDVERTLIDSCTFDANETGIKILGSKKTTISSIIADSNSECGCVLHLAEDAILCNSHLSGNNTSQGAELYDLIVNRTIRAAVLGCTAQTYHQNVADDTRTDGSLLGY
jgi:nitrous oxidase accessory protein NosD